MKNSLSYLTMSRRIILSSDDESSEMPTTETVISVKDEIKSENPEIKQENADTKNENTKEEKSSRLSLVSIIT